MNVNQSSDQYERQSCPETHSPIIEGLRANAQAALEELSSLTDFDFGYNRESVQWLQGYIERMKQAGVFSGPAREKLTSVFGAFLGECIIHCYGGAWKKRDGAWGIAFDDDHIALPFSAIDRQVEHGPLQGIRKFFGELPILFVGCIDAKAQPQKRWWKFWPEIR